MGRCDASDKVSESWVRAESGNPDVRFDEIRNVGRSFLVGFFEKFEGFVLLAQACVDDADHVGRNVGNFRLALRFAKYLLSVGLPAYRGINVCESGRGI